MKHWSPEVLELARARAHLYLFADFDGTLAPIAPRPEEARLPERARAVLGRLTARAATRVAIVSGRPVETLERMVAVAGLAYVGNHGMETLAAEGRREEDPSARLARPAIARLGAKWAERAARTEGAVLEQKGISLSLHTRLVTDDATRAALERDAVALAELEPALAHSGGKRIVEVKPRGAPDKGIAIARLLERAHGPGWPERCAAVFLGDDLTDEDGFRILETSGAGVRVLDGVPFPTRARFCAHGVDDALTLLEALAAI